MLCPASTANYSCYGGFIHFQNVISTRKQVCSYKHSREQCPLRWYFYLRKGFGSVSLGNLFAIFPGPWIQLVLVFINKYYSVQDNLLFINFLEVFLSEEIWHWFWEQTSHYSIQMFLWLFLVNKGKCFWFFFL